MKPVVERSTKEIKKVIARLEDALGAGVGELAACDYAEIDHSDFETLIKMHPELKRLAEKSLSVLGVKASIVIKEAIEEKDLPTARWYKEHTDPNFSRHVKVENSVSLSADERGEVVDKLFDEIKNE